MADETENVKKKIRMMDHDRAKYAQAMQSQMLKQQEHITTIKKDNDKLRQDLAAQTGGRYTFGEHEKLASMETDSESLDSKIQFEKLRQTDIEKKLHMARLETMQVRRSMGSVTVTQDNTALIDKQVHVLENRLDQALVKFNEALSFNRDLRQSIDNLREERKVFNNIYKKLEQELHKKKRDMADVIERSNKDYEERDALQLQLDSLRAAAKEDAKKYEEHFQSLEAMMQQYKAQREQQQQQAAAQALQQQKQQLAAENAQSTNNERSGKGKKESQKDQSDANLDATSNNQDNEGDLEDVIEQLKEATGIQDLDVLYHKFLKSEEHNFSMYNFVNELNSEVELLETEIGQLKEQLHSERGDVQRRKMLKDLENELARTEQQHENTVEKTAHLKDTLDVIRSITQEIFTKIGCSAEQTAELLGTTECTEINLLDFLGIIEQRTNEIMYQYNIAADNEMKRRAAGKDEEAKRRRDRRQAERDARIEAGENVPPEDEDEYNDDEEETALVEAGGDGEPTKGKFLGVGPQVATGTIDLPKTVKSMGLPTTNAGEGNDADDLDDDAPISLDDLRARATLNLQNKKDERGGRRRKGDKKAKANN